MSNDEVRLEREREHEDRTVTIVVNTRPYEWAAKTISYEEVIELVYPGQPINAGEEVTVSFSRGHDDKREGSLTLGRDVKVKNKMVFDVYRTSLAHNADLGRLLDDGFDVNLIDGHLVIRRIPYVTVEKVVAYGFLTYPVTVSGDQVVSGTDHRIWFGGTAPYNEHGDPLMLATPETHVVSGELAAAYMLSSKPVPHGYSSEYEKVTAYARILSHPAQTLDPTVTATLGGAWQEVEEDLPFRYRDTATSRAGLTVLSQVFRAERVVIIGLGGSGGYILDQVAKTPVPSILLIDGDVLDNHNAFRAPGAATLDQLRGRPPKVDYFGELYGQMHTGITTAYTYHNKGNLDLLDGATFVFLAMDDATMKADIAAYVLQRGIPFIDVGMGVEEVDSKLSGLLRMVFATPGEGAEHVLDRIPKPAEERDDYGRNIQVADLNALNAMLAIGRWKRHLGFYADGSNEEFATYSIYTNHINSESIASADGQNQ